MQPRVKLIINLLLVNQVLFSCPGIVSSFVCRERNRMISSLRTDLHKLVACLLGTDLTLACHYCNEHDDLIPKLWYHQTFYEDQASELIPDMQTNISTHHYTISPEHYLIIKNITQSDGGHYYCHGTDREDEKYKFNYMIDLVPESNLTKLHGNISSWEVYHKMYLEPVTKQFRLSSMSGISQMLQKCRVELEVITVWEDWGLCSNCSNQKGIKSQLGKCIVNSVLYRDQIVNFEKSTICKVLRNVGQLSCQSTLLEDVFYNISVLTKNIPDFVHTETCFGICAKAKEIEEIRKKKKKKKKKTDARFKKRLILQEGEHVTLVCPEASAEKIIVWKRKDKTIEQNDNDQTPEEKDDRVFVDSFGSLYLSEVTDDESDTYICFVDGVKMEQVKVVVVSSSRLLFQVLLRHMAYLIFIFFMCFVCYCAGVAVSCTKRHKYLGYRRI